MSINSKLAYYNIQVKTAPIVEKIAKLIFTLSGTKQVYSDIYINKIDSRFPSFRLYRYQADVYEAITKGNNVLIVSGTGSGKTEACFFPLLPQLNRGVSGQVLAIYPTNVLASQQQERIQAYGKKFGINIQHWSGETIKEIFIPTAEIVTSNPNFLLDNFRKNNRYEKFKEVFESLNTLIFDEIHIYNAREIALLTEVIRLIIPKQIIFLSATVGNLDEVAQTLSNINGKSTYIFKGSSQKAVTQYIILPQLSYKDQISLFIQYLIEPGMTIIFTQSISQADNLRISVIEQAMFASFLQQFPHTTRKDILEDMVTVHHSGLSKEERLKLEKRLKSGSMLVFSPKTLAQGIDVANVVRVVHLGLPNSLADFLQREGRAGRRQETQWTESIIICSNDYDELIFTNQATFEAYINGTPERILLLPASPIAQLFNACFHYKILPSGLKTENKQILKQYGMLETINSKKLTPTGKMFWKEELSFYGPSRQIYYLQQGGKQRNKPDRISVKELFTKFQPNTLHYKYGVLQKVINYTGEGFYIQPVFEEVKESLIKKLFKGNSLRSYT
ncbi:MAG: DEAD/DEAH box helicase, partial [Candidatus Thorarchaeota archaeon]